MIIKNIDFLSYIKCLKDNYQFSYNKYRIMITIYFTGGKVIFYY